MFTGLVLGMGEVTRLDASAEESRITFRPLFPLSGYVKGESIAVNGACLSVEHFDATTFTAYASHETLRLSTLDELKRGSRVNLERALALGDRLGGHMVSGHVDGVATVASITPKGASRIIRVNFPPEFATQVIAKGSVALDGISLTINTCGDNFLEVNVIPETQQATTIHLWNVGKRLNFETDLIGKYVEKMLGGRTGSSQKSSNITLDFLRENGF